MSKTSPTTKVLAGFIWDGKSGGIDAYLVAFAHIASQHGVQVDFLTNEYTADFDEELRSMGHRLFEIATLHDRGSQRETIEKLHRENAYDAAYFNISTPLMYPVVKDAKRAGIPRVAVHSHAAGTDQPNRLKRMVFDAVSVLLRPLVNRVTDVRLACSQDAGRWMFGDSAVQAGKVVVVPNPVNVERCAFDAGARERKRAELGVEDKLVVGSVTAMKEVKNPFFLVDLFAEVLRIEPRAVLVAVGGGELTDEVSEYAADHLPTGSYQLLGKRADVHELLQAFDTFVLTSRKEGLSIAAIEAQAAGLSCLLSDGVPEEAVVAPELAQRLSLAAGKEVWAGKLLSLSTVKLQREGWAEKVAGAGYSPNAPLVAVKLLKMHDGMECDDKERDNALAK